MNTDISIPRIMDASSIERAMPSIQTGDIKVGNSGNAGIVAGIFQNIAIQKSVNIDQDVKATLNNLKEKLKHRYLEPHVPSIPWLSNVQLPISKFYTDLEMHLQEAVRRTSAKKLISIQEIFLPDEGIDPLRILISGTPGCGKSTLLKKLAHEWAKGTEYMSRFDLVLIIPLRFVTENIEMSLLNTLMIGEKYEKCLALEVLRRHEDKVLLLLDGYDELKKDLESNITSLIRGEKYPEMTVVITSRRGKFILPESEKKHIFADHQFLKFTNLVCTTPESLCRRHIFISGISQQKQKEFLELHLSAASSNENLCSFSKAQSIIQGQGRQLCESPLYLLLIAALITEVDVTIPRTMSQLYKMIVAFVMNRDKCLKLAKRISRVPREHFTVIVEELFSMKKIHFGCADLIFEQLGRYLFTDICNTESGLAHFGKALRQRMERSLRPLPYQLPLYFHDDNLELLGKFAFDLISKGKLFFTERELMKFTGENKTILQLGLFIPSICTISDKWEKTYEPIHKSVFEFFCAFYLRTLFLKNERKHFRTFVYLLKDLWPQEGSDSLLFPFLAGLLKHEMHIVFELIRPVAFQYSHHFASLLDTLLECEISDNFFNSITDFLPIEWSLQMWSQFPNVVQREYLQYAVDSKRAQILNLDQQFIFTVTEPIKVWQVRIFMNNIHYIAQQNVQMLRCDEIICNVGNIPMENTHIWKKFCSLVKLFGAKSITIHLDEDSGYSLFLLHKELTAGLWQGITLHNLHYNFKVHAKHVMPDLILLISQSKIKSLNITIDQVPENSQCSICDSCECQLTDKELQQLITVIGESQIMSKVFVRNHALNVFELDISPLFCKRRSWEWLWFWKVRIVCTKYQDGVTINLLDLVPDNGSILEGLLTYPITVLTCVSETFGKLVNISTRRHWIGLETIKELLIVLHDVDINEEYFQYFKNLQNLKVLTFWLTNPVHQITLLQYRAAVKELLAILKSISQASFELWFVEANLPFFNVVVEQIEEYNEMKNSHHSTSSSNIRLMECLMLYVNTSFDSYNYTAEQADAIMEIISLFKRLKEPVKKKTCQTLQIVCQKSFSRFLQHNQPFGISSLAGVFPHNEGYVILHDLYGSKQTDSIRARYELQYQGAYQRFTVAWESA